MVPNRLVPTADRLSPAKRLGESISIKSLGRFTIMVLKMLAILSVALIIFRNSLPEILRLVELQPAEIASRLFELSCRICLWTGSTLLVFSGLDYALAWWQHERDLMMTEQELRDELRDAEGAKQPVKTARSEAVRGVT
jgi:flagellar biosynthesis protein FlhB